MLSRFGKAKVGRKILATASLALLSSGVYAQPGGPVIDRVEIPLETLAELRWIMAMLIIIVVLLGFIVLLLKVKDPSSFSIMKMMDFTGSYATDPETDHEYDGIRELDNPVPAWLKLMMYGGVLFGVVYVMHYHVLKTGALQIEEYEMEMAAAAVKYKSVELDEDAIVYRDDEASLAKGQSIYLELCQACHLADGGGSVGPNLTDDYWLHGGKIKDIYTTITEGVPEKGMISWKKQLTSQQRVDVSSFIMSLKGTTPAVAKEAQGTLMSGDGNDAAEEALTYLSDAASLASGKEIYMQYCQACHLEDGGGSIGPNLTDKYWLHGGSINDIFKTVTVGVPEKGMVPWEKQLDAKQRLEVSSFILSLQGTTPAKAKDPQGDLYEPDAE